MPIQAMKYSSRFPKLRFWNNITDIGSLIRTGLEMCHEQNIHIFHGIKLIFCQFYITMRWSFWPSYIKIGKELTIFYWYHIFQPVWNRVPMSVVQRVFFHKNITYVTEHASLAMDFDESATSSGGLVLQHALTTEMIMRAFCYPSTKKVK